MFLKPKVSMEVDDLLILRLEKLSRLKLDDSERLTIKDELTSIIGMFDKLTAIDTTDVQPLTHLTDVFNVMRNDEVLDHLKTENALKNARESVHPYFSVPKVIK